VKVAHYALTLTMLRGFGFGTPPPLKGSATSES
jgi:hypothetical protein